VQQLNLADYRGFTLSVVVLALMVTAIEWCGTYLRLHASPRVVLAALLLIAAGGIAALAFTPDPPWRMLASAPEHLRGYLAGAAPQWTSDMGWQAGTGVVQTILIAVFGTLVGGVLALPLALLSAWPVSRGWMRGTGWRPYSWPVEVASRTLLTATRSIPPLALGLVGIITVGVGPVAGAFALTLHTAGVLGKLLAESFDVADRQPAEALVAGGATGAAATLIALVAASMSAMVAHILYRFEWNVRAATTLGMIGAGGLGQAIFTSQQMLFYHQLSSYVLIAIALVLIIDWLGGRVRSRFRLERLEI